MFGRQLHLNDLKIPGCTNLHRHCKESWIWCQQRECRECTHRTGRTKTTPSNALTVVDSSGKAKDIRVDNSIHNAPSRNFIGSHYFPKLHFTRRTKRSTRSIAGLVEPRCKLQWCRVRTLTTLRRVGSFASVLSVHERELWGWRVAGRSSRMDSHRNFCLTVFGKVHRCTTRFSVSFSQGIDLRHWENKSRKVETLQEIACSSAWELLKKIWVALVGTYQTKILKSKIYVFWNLKPQQSMLLLHCKCMIFKILKIRKFCFF